MNKLDTLVLSGLAVVLFYPAIISLVRAAIPSTSPEEVTKERWQQRWTHTLIDLLADLDSGGMKQGAALCRELMWEIIGGDQGGKK